MKKNLMRILIAFVVAAALAFGLEALQIATQPKLYSAETRVVREPGMIDYAACELENAEADEDGMLKLSAGESSFLYRAPEAMHLSRLSLEFKKTLKRSVALTVSYAAEGEEFSADRTVSAEIEDGESYGEIELPEGDYIQVKFVFDTEKSATLRPIVYAEGVEERVPVDSPLRPGRIALLAGLLFAAILCMMALGTGRFLAGAFRGGWRGLTENRMRTLIRLGVFAGVGAAVWGLLRLTVPGILNKDFNWMQNLFCILTAVCAACLFTFRDTLGKKPEVFFLVFCLVIGSMYSFLLPVTCIGPDEGFHSEHAEQASYLGELRQTAVEPAMQEENAEVVYELGEKRDAWLAEMNNTWREGAISANDEEFDTKCIWSVVPGIGMYLGRVTGLPYHLMWGLGRFFNLLGYAVIGYFAIRRLKSGKMILAAVLMIPTSLWLSSIYSYDAGFNALMALFCAYAIAQWQEPEKKIRWSEFFVMIVSFVIAGLTKAVYVPMILLLFLLPKDKYEDNGQRRLMIIIEIAAVLLLLLSFLLPFLTGQSGDERGGDGINAFGQATFILTQPLAYTRILLNFLKTHCFSVNINARLGNLGTLGFIENGAVYLALMAVVAFTDKTDEDLYLAKKTGTRLLGLFFLFATVVLYCTALYVSYNPVGSTYIAGVQHRYLYAVMFPAMMLLAPGSIRNGMNRKVYNGIVFAVIAYVNLAAVLTRCIGLFG